MALGGKPIYGCWQDVAFSYGPNHKDIKTRLQHDLCTNGNIFRDFERGAGLRVGSSPSRNLVEISDRCQSYYMTMPMPKKDEAGWVFIDVSDFLIQTPALEGDSSDSF